MADEQREGSEHDMSRSKISGTKLMLGLHENRIAAVEATMATVLAKVSAILLDTTELKRFLAREACVQTSIDMHDMPTTGIDAATCTPAERLECESEKVERVGDGRTGQPPSITQQLAPGGGPVGSLGTALPPHDNVPSHSAAKNGGGEEGSMARGRPANIVHNNPRMKVVPFESRLAVARTPACKEKAPMSVAAGKAPFVPRYKDPPGYENVTDFGCTSDSDYTVPNLQPRNSSVS